MRVIVVEPGKPAYSKDIPGKLEVLQSEVGGYIETLCRTRDGTVIICNEEGKIHGLKPNVILYDGDNRPYDVLCGTFLVAGLGEEDFCDLTPEQESKYLEVFSNPNRIG